MEGVQARNRLDPQALTVATAINGTNKSKDLIRWVLKKFASYEHVAFILLYVDTRVTDVHTSEGSFQKSQMEEVEGAFSENRLDSKTREMLSSFKKMFNQKEVQSDVLVIKSEDVANAIYQTVDKRRIKKLVIGASSSNIFTRKLKRTNLSSRISDMAPRFCTVYQVSKGKLISKRPSDDTPTEILQDDCSEKSWFSDSRSTSTASSSRTHIGSSGPGSQFQSPSLPLQRKHALFTMNQTLYARDSRTVPVKTKHNRGMSWNVEGSEKDLYGRDSRFGSEADESFNLGNSRTDDPAFFSFQESKSNGNTDSFSSDSQMTFDFEVEKLKIELRHARGMYSMAQTEIMGAGQKMSDLNQLRLDGAAKLKELKIKEEEAEETTRKEKKKNMEATKEAEHLRERAEIEASQRKEVEMRAEKDERENQRLQIDLTGPLRQYVEFSWEEIEDATSSFSEDLKIGMGSYGSVYKCDLHHTTVAVKVLHSEKKNMVKQFDQELEILSKIRHPHLLLLLGACPERGCLIYEYMKNGSLEERLLRRGDNSPPLRWFERYRIAWEVASALNFLHTAKPKPIVHRDLKPANILLDHNLVSKIGDVGLSKMVNLDPTYTSTLYKDTAPVGTFFYIDPEYQRSGLVSPISDIYAFGIIILQLLTAKPARGLVLMVERSIKSRKLEEIFDSNAGTWPLDETLELAELGLRCTQLRHTDRPDLQSEILPVLERLKHVAETAKDSCSTVEVTAPNHFICPILKDVMKDPYVAADGHTYERRAIEKWLEENNKSPVTNQPLSSNNLLPNYAILSAITEWRSNIEQHLN